MTPRSIALPRPRTRRRRRRLPKPPLGFWLCLMLCAFAMGLSAGSAARGNFQFAASNLVTAIVAWKSALAFWELRPIDPRWFCLQIVNLAVSILLHAI